MNAIDLFGGKESLATCLFKLMSSQGPSPELFRDSDPVDAISRISKHELLDWMFTQGIGLREAMPLQWTPEQKSKWLDEVHKRGTPTVVAENGNATAVDDADLTLGLLVRLEALSELCHPPRDLPAEKLKSLRSLRSKYHTLLAKAV